MNLTTSAFATKKRLITSYGLRLLREYVSYLKAKQIDELEALRTAKEHGDLRENAEFKSAKESTQLTASRLQEMEAMLTCQVTTSPPDTSTVRFGATVKLLKDEVENCAYTIGSSVEVMLCTDMEQEGVVVADAPQGKMISYDSPLGRSLLMQQVGSSVACGDSTYKIVSISY